jgi:hypothetical protein
MVNILETFVDILVEQRILDDIKSKYVGDGEKQISPDTYNEIVDVSGNKVPYIVWLVKMVMGGNILIEDLYKYDDYLKIFTRYKHLYKEKDINKYVSRDDLKYFLQTTIGIREKDVNVSSSEDTSKNYVNVSEIKKLEDVGIKYLGMSEGYQVFEVPNELKDSEEAWTRYRDILGRCAGRDRGAKIDICTIASNNHFRNYLEDYPGSSYFVMFNLSDPKSPYQFHYESSQFMDKNDNNVLEI